MNLILKKACELAGGQSKLAEKIGVTTSAVNQWVKGNRPIPIDRCVAIERATNGNITRRDLRPDDWTEIWPELITHIRLDISQERRRSPGRRASDAKVGRRTRKKTQ